MIDYSNFRLSLKNLQKQYENYQTLDDSLPELLQEAVAESVIHRFTVCWDCLWKVLHRYLLQETGLADIPSKPRPVIQEAHNSEYLSSSFDQWVLYLEARNATSHDYSGEKALDALELMDDFIDDAIGLYQTMTNETWE